MNDAPQALLGFGDFRIDRGRRILARTNGEVLPLTPKHFDTLLYLVENAGEVLDKERLMAAIWPATIVEENNLSQAISHLRRVLGDDGAEHRYILTVPRRGYRFVASVQEVEDDKAAAVRAPPEVESSNAPTRRPRLRSAATSLRLAGVAAALVLVAAAVIVWRMPATDAVTAQAREVDRRAAVRQLLGRQGG